MFKVSVLMPVYNGEAFLNEAIESILGQSFQDFEFVIVNDGSTDSTDQIIKSYSNSRVRYLKLPRNVGLSEALNAGLEVAQGTYLARMDADDLSCPTRLAMQVKFLDEHPEYVAVGCFVAKMDQQRKMLLSEGGRFIEDADLRLGLTVENVYYHGEVMYRKETLVRNRLKYQKKFYPADDYRMWCELSKFGKLGVVEQILYVYMINELGISATKKALMRQKVREVSEAFIAETGRPFRTLREVNNLSEKVRKLQNSKIWLNGNLIEIDLKSYYQRFLALAARRFIFELPLQAIYLLVNCARIDSVYFSKILAKYIASGVKFAFAKASRSTV